MVITEFVIFVCLVDAEMSLNTDIEMTVIQ